MANYKPIGVPFDRTFRNDLNENFKTLDGVASSAKGDADTAKKAATSAAQSAQQAQAEATSAKQASELAISKADDTQAQLDDIIIESGTSDAELVQARGGETLLYKRLDKTDVELAETSIEVGKKADKTYVDNVKAQQEIQHQESLDRIETANKDLRGFTATASQNEAPIICIAKRTSTFSVPDQTSGGYTEVLWNSEDIDSDGMHINTTSDSSKMSVKTEGIYRIETSINWSGVNAGIREVLIYKNGSPIERTSMTVNQSSNLTVQVSVTDMAKNGDYYTVHVRQTSGIELFVQPSISKFTAIRIGTPIGPRGGIRFDSAFAYRGISMYPNTILPERVVIQSDPVKGSSRQVACFTTRKEDAAVYYPRVQLATSSFLANNDDFYVGFGVYVPLDFEFIDGSNDDVMIHEIYGPPFNGGAPNSLRIFGPNFSIFPDVDNYPTPQWSMPVTKGKWFDFIFRYKMSKDPTIGFVELWVNKGDGLIKQSIAGQDRFYHATMKAGVNDSGSNYSTIKVAYDNESIRNSASVLFANHKIGSSTMSSVDPGSYS